MTQAIQRTFDGQKDFSGGWNMRQEIAANQYFYAKNFEIEGTQPVTRHGFRRAFRVLVEGFRKGFWFGDKSAGSGFWFPFDFVQSIWGVVQGTSFFRFLADSAYRQIVVTGGRVYVHHAGFVDELTTTDSIATTEEIEFVQADQWLVMLRGDDANAMYWTGSTATGFVTFPTGSPDSMPNGTTGAYINGRLYVVRDRDDIYVSDALEPANYDQVYQLFSVSRGDGDEIMRIVPFQEDYAIVFKKKKTFYLAGTNANVVQGTYLNQYVTLGGASQTDGLVARKAVAVSGEDVMFLSYNGITSISRMEEGKLRGMNVPLSYPIQPMIDRINWAHVGCACAVAHKNRVVFAVPIDGSTVNNIGLVYNRLLNNGAGAWEGTIESELFRPVEFFTEDQDLYFIDTQGAMRKMWCDDPWDTEDPFDDVPVYAATTHYEPGDRVYYLVSGEGRLFRCIKEVIGTAPPSATYWTEETDPQNLYRVSSELVTKYYRGGDLPEQFQKRFGPSQIVFDHQNPKVTLKIEGEDYKTAKTLRTDVTYDRTKYDIVAADWDSSNVNLDFANPHRRDYTVFLPSTNTTDTSDNKMVNGDWSSSLDGWTLTMASAGGSAGFATDEEVGTYLHCVFNRSDDPEIYATLTGTFTAPLGGEYHYSFHYRLYTPIGRSSPYGIVTFPGHLFTVTFDKTTGWGEVSGNVNLSAGQTIQIQVVTAISGDSTVTFDLGAVGIYPRISMLTMDADDGIDLNVWETHRIPFVPNPQNNNSFRLRIANTQGKFRLKNILLGLIPAGRALKPR